MVLTFMKWTNRQKHLVVFCQIFIIVPRKNKILSVKIGRTLIVCKTFHREGADIIFMAVRLTVYQNPELQ